MNLIKKIASERNVGLEKIAKNTGIPVSTVYAIANDKCEPGVFRAIKIAKALNSTVEEVFI